VGSAAAIALTSATPAIAANQALMLNGIGLSIGSGLLPDVVMANVLGGIFNTYERTGVPWPMQARPVTGPDSLTLTDSVAIGVDNLDAAIKTALAKTGPGEHVTVVGLSAGALVADDVLRKLATDPNSPAKGKLTFVVVADSSRANFNKNRLDKTLNYQYRTPANTKYDTVVVTAEYDGFADFPDRVWNIVAVVNAYAGEIVKHVPSVFTDLTTVDKSNITVTTNSLGGVTTQYFIQAEHLPLVELLPFLAPQEAQLKKIVDAGYIRNDAKSAATPPAAAVAVANNSDSAPVDSPQAVAPANAALEQAPAETVANKQPVRAAEPAAAPVADALDTATQDPAASAVDAPQQAGRRAAATRGSAGSGVTHRSSANPARSAAASRVGKSPSA
jgi:hypothetical protein